MKGSLEDCSVLPKRLLVSLDDSENPVPIRLEIEGKIPKTVAESVCLFECFYLAVSLLRTVPLRPIKRLVVLLEVWRGKVMLLSTLKLILG